MHFSLVRISTPHMPDTRGFDDVLLPLALALESLGYRAEIRHNSFNPHSRNICLGANYDPGEKWLARPAGTIIFNLEQLQASGYPWLKDGRYLEVLGRRQCWDFSLRNVEYLAARGIEAAFLPLGYVPEMTRLAPCPAPPDDVLFYGAMTPRRRKILEELIAAGLKVRVLTRAYGRRRDQALFSAKVFLNIHHSLPASLEIVRLGYVLANGRAVVSELAPDTYFYPELQEACAFAEYEGLAELTLALVRDGARRDEQAGRGQEAFSALRLDRALEKLVGRRTGPGRGADFPARPDRLRVGSGTDFRAGALNLDCDPRFRPDVTLDFSGPLPPGRVYDTARFGPVTLAPGSFELISGPGLGRPSDQMMANCLELLRPGGRLELTLPGGTEEFLERHAGVPGPGGVGFAVESAAPDLSEYGRVKRAAGLDLAGLSGLPGAVSGWRVSLIKRLFEPEELAEAQTRTREYLLRPAPEWTVEEPDAEPEAGPPENSSRPGLRWRLRLARLKIRRWRYAFNVRFRPHQGHGRYQEKIAELDREAADLRRWLHYL